MPSSSPFFSRDVPVSLSPDYVLQCCFISA
jgi:hypothetical protein